MNNPDELLEILDRFRQVKILVVGDVMLDRYWWGRASRLSPEAPVPVVALEKVSLVPGGAANVAANAAGFGAEVFLAGVVGADDAARSLRQSLENAGLRPDFLVSSANRPTTTKTRVIVHHQQIARVDDETNAPLAADEEEKLLAQIKDLIPPADLIVLSDYAKGCLTRSLIAAVVAEAARHEKMILADPKSRDFTKYNGATLLTPNLAEAAAAAGLEHSGDEKALAVAAAEKLLATVEIDSLLVTLGEHGMKLFRRGQPRAPVYFPSLARQVFDVTGAGDTVIASLAAALGARADMHSAITLANIAAGLSVEKVGTSIVPLDELRTALQNKFSSLAAAAKRQD
jgi:rfaE bifunctional protein kinase chain/domain